MSQGAYEVKVTLQRATKVKDNAGGKTLTWNAVSTGHKGFMHYYAAERIMSRERVGTSGPGRMAQTEMFIEFKRNAPVAVRGDRILLETDYAPGGIVIFSAGHTFPVEFVRGYQGNLQLDIETVS